MTAEGAAAPWTPWVPLSTPSNLVFEEAAHRLKRNDRLKR
jgi:hypothetical protein